MQLPTDLPRGVSAVIMNGAIRYRVRTSKFGKRQSLGTFLTLDDAIQALTKFQYGMLQDYVEQAEKAKEQILEQQKEKYFFLLQDAPLYKLQEGKEYRTFDEEGNIAVVPGSYVTMYLQSLEENTGQE